MTSRGAHRSSWLFAEGDAAALHRLPAIQECRHGARPAAEPVARGQSEAEPEDREAGGGV